jgi:hypothetical protein
MSREDMVTKVAKAMEAADEQNLLVDWDCMCNETVVDWTALAEAAVDAVVEILQPPF